MKSIHVFAIAFVAAAVASAPKCSAQTAEALPPFKSPELVMAKEGVHTLWLQYTPPRYDAESQKFIGYFRQGEAIFRAESPSGLNGTWINNTPVTGGPQSIVKRGGEYFAFDHHWRLDEGWYHHHAESSSLSRRRGATPARHVLPSGIHYPPMSTPC